MRIPGATRRDSTAGIYGTIVAISIVAGLSDAHDLGPPQALEILLTGQAVLWLGHVYARYLARKADPNSPALERLLHIALYEWPMLRSCLPSALSIGLWWSGAVSEDAAYWLALSLGIGSLAVLGFVYGRRVGQGPLLATATAGVDTALGALVVVAKVVAG